MYISITKTTHPGTLLPSDQLGFGIHYTDHMFIMDYSDEKGWYDPRIVPFQNISLSPAACVFHYGAEVFEGLKAYRRPDGEVQLFRPWDNMERMKNSAIRLGLPVVPPEDALEAVKALVKVDERWVPSDPGTSLYIRPFLYGTDAKLGLHGVHTAQFIIILSPVGSYFDNGMEPVKIIVETEDVRAVRGGTGEAKCGGNYGASNRAGERAFANGYSQVLWLDGVEHKYVEEGGGMNVVFKINGRIITPMLTGSILPGVTRRSCLQLFEDWGMPVEERLISVDELFEAAANGTLEEAMCVGTAAVICPIGELTYEGKAYTINNFQTGPLAQKLYDTLTGIQWGTQPDSQFNNIPNSIYWAIVTMTTVGYGDITPVTGFGKFLSACVMLIGYTIIAVPTGIVSASMMKDYKRRRDKECPNCHRSGHEDNAEFCKYCGHKLNND